MHRRKGECAHFRCNKCPIYTHDGASAKFKTNSHEMAYSVLISLYDIFELDPKNYPILSGPRRTMNTK